VVIGIEIDVGVNCGIAVALLAGKEDTCGDKVVMLSAGCKQLEIIVMKNTEMKLNTKVCIFMVVP